ncbi:MAG: hypothetical protein ACXAC7_17055, partial [Candidatus Hodarchaeales archaeon]
MQTIYNISSVSKYQSNYSEQRGRYQKRNHQGFLILLAIFISLIHPLSSVIISNRASIDQNMLSETNNSENQNLNRPNKLSNISSDNNSANNSNNFAFPPKKSSTNLSNELTNKNEISNSESRYFQEKTDFSGSGSSTLIKANETFVTKKNDVYFNTSNDFGSIPRNDSQVLSFMDNNYENITGSFDLENITAAIDHAVIEDDHTNRTSAPSQLSIFPTAAFKAIATSFEVKDLSVNLTRVYLSLATGAGTPSGEIYITGVSGSTPEPNTTIFGDKINIGSISGACQLGCSFSFDNPVTLIPGTYAIVMLDTASTHNDFDYYNWYFVEDSNNINNSIMWKYSWSGTWGAYTPASDLLFEYEFIRLNDSDTSQRLVYDSPLEVNLTYNGS